MLSDAQIAYRHKLYRQAREFLSTILADGPQPYSTIVTRAAEAGISLSTLLTAKVALQVGSRKVDRKAVWFLRSFG